MNIHIPAKIFLVDDDQFCLNTYEHFLHTQGFDAISSFSCGKDLIANLDQLPDLIFLDYNLNDCKGDQLFELIKQKCPSAGTVFISGQSQMEIAVQMLNAGALDYIIKGENDIEKIKTVLGKWMALYELSGMMLGENRQLPADNYLKMMAEAQQKLRKEISNELHDNVSQLLVASKLYLDAAVRDDKNRADLLIETKGLLTTAITELKALSYNLQIAQFKQLDLEEEINKIITPLRHQSGCSIQTEITLKGLSQLLSAHEKLAIIRIVQEQLNNTFKYAQANLIKIRIWQSNDFLQLKIEDNGIGFELNEVKRGLGLTNIFDRVQGIKGFCNLVTAPGKGCKWHIKIPLKPIYKREKIKK